MSSISIQKIGVTELDVDAVVNAANEGLWEGGGVCGAIFSNAGSAELTKACNAIGHCDTGNAVITPGFKLKAKYVIHAVGPRYTDGKHGEKELLYGTYANSLRVAKENDCHSIGFPLISSGIFGYPKEEAFKVAIEACNDFIQSNSYEMDIIFAVIGDGTYSMGQKILSQSGSTIPKSSNPFEGMIQLLPELKSVTDDNVDEVLGDIHKAYFDFADKKTPGYEIGFFSDRIDELKARFNCDNPYEIDIEKLDKRDTVFIMALSFSMGRWDDGAAFKAMLLNGTVAHWVEHLDELLKR